MGKRKKGNRNEESDEKEAEESDPRMRGRDPDLAEGSGSLL